MMTKEEFQKEYHEFSTHSRREAILHAWLVNSTASGFRVCVVQFSNLGQYCLMLEEAAEAMGPLLGMVTEKKQQS